MAVSVYTTCVSRASRRSPLVPLMKSSPRSTVAAPSLIVSARTGVPSGTYVRTPFAFSAGVGPAIKAASASCGVAAGRVSGISCSPWRK